MYPLDVILIGIDESLLSAVRDELQKCQARIESEQANTATAVDLKRQAAEWTGTGDGRSRLLIIHLGAGQDLDELRRLRSTFAGWPILVLLEGKGDPAALISAMREGATQVVPLPFQAADFQAALDAIAQQFGPSVRASRVLAVSGVTGGIGATTLALNLGHELAGEHQIRCLLVDLCLQMGMLAPYLNIEPESTIHDVLQDVGRQHLYAVQKGLTRVADNLKLIAGPYQAIAAVAVQADNVLQLIQYCRRLAEFIVLDVPCTYDALYFKILAAADDIILVAEQKVPSIRAAKLIGDRLARETRFAAPHLVINRYNPKLKGFGLDDLEKLLTVRQISSIAHDDVAVTAAVNQGRPLRQEAPQSRVLADIDALCETLLGIRTPARAPTEDFNVLGRLVRAFGLS